MLISSVDSFPMLTSSRQVTAAHKCLPPGATIRKIAGDGNCLFRALSLSLFGTQDQHTVLRNQIVANVVQNWSHYSSYIVGDKSYGQPINSANDYKNHMSKNGTEGGHLELNVATRIFDILIKVYNSKTSKVISLGRSKYSYKKEIDLLYTGEGDKGHYDAIFLDRKKLASSHDDKNSSESNKKDYDLNSNSFLSNNFDEINYNESDDLVEFDVEEITSDYFSNSLPSSKSCDSDKAEESVLNSSSESSRKTRQSVKADVKSDKNSSHSTEMGIKKGKKSGNAPFHLECSDDQLSEAQQAAISKVTNEFNEACNTLNALVAKFDGEVFEKGEITICQLKALLSRTPVPANPASPLSVVTNPPVSPVLASSTPLVNVRPQAVLANASPTGGYQFLVNKNSLGVLVSSNASKSSPVPRPTTPVISNVSTPVTSQNRPIGRQIPPPLKTSTPTTSQVRPSLLMKSLIPSMTALMPSPPPAAAVTVSQSAQRAKAPKTRAQPTVTATNSANSTTPTAASGPKARKVQSAAVVDLTSDEGKGQEPDSREMVFSKVAGKTFPSLVVIARPNLRIKEFTPTLAAQERKTLDGDVKNVLMYSPPKFCEWLLQQGLVSSEQHCSVHVYPDMSPVKLKLGMYSDASKFPFSGGYVWISDCCPAKFVSVFNDSLFENSSTPTTTLKLIYHWACQTSIANVVQWVKVNNLYVKNFYTHMRAVCTAALHDKLTKIGGPRKRIEVGVISLGTTSADGHLRQVKVEVLGVLDPETKQIFLCAVEPTPDSEKNYKRRFSKILEHLETWVHKSSVILTDFTVDKGTLTSMGFNSVYQVSINDSANATNKYSNYNIMEYLRRIVPRMFQNTLSLLSRNIIQQFLDELVWRETYGPTAARAYKTIIQHIAEQTKLKISGETLLSRLTKIAVNPFKNWSTAMQQSNALAAAAVAAPPVTNQQVKLPPATPEFKAPPPVTGIDALPASITEIDTPVVEPVKKPESSGKRRKQANGLGPDPKKLALDLNSKLVPIKPSVTLEPLNPYYYGTYQSNKEIINSEEKVDLDMKCCVCREVFHNNMKVMMHMIAHAFNSDVQMLPSELDPYCKYCLKQFTSQLNLNNHIDEEHSRIQSDLRCLICKEQCKDRSTIILHMHRNHCELELPYECGICYYRASEHKKVVDHFYEVHNGSGKVQCPLCLKIVALKTNGRNIGKNMFFFIHHIQKHNRKSIARKCDKCELQFVHKGILKEHKEKDHVSYVGVPDVERYEASVDSLMMPKPLPNSNNVKKAVKQNLLEATGYKTYTVNKFLSMKLSDIPEEATCSECEGFIMNNDHFEGKFSCIVCTYSTYCGKAMYEHSQIFHSQITGAPKEVFNIGTPIILPEAMHCVCGFKSRSGNKLAKHLALCKRKSAYPSRERAAQNTVESQSASFPPLVTLDDADNSDPSDTWLRAFVNENAEKMPPPPPKKILSEAPAMLNMLGLARKDPADERNSKASDEKLDSPVSAPENSLVNHQNNDESNTSLKVAKDLVDKTVKTANRQSDDVIEIDNTEEDQQIDSSETNNAIAILDNPEKNKEISSEANNMIVLHDNPEEDKQVEANDLMEIDNNPEEGKEVVLYDQTSDIVELHDNPEEGKEVVLDNQTNDLVELDDNPEGGQIINNETNDVIELHDNSEEATQVANSKADDIIELLNDIDEQPSENCGINPVRKLTENVEAKLIENCETSALDIIDVKSCANNDMNMLGLENGENCDLDIIDFETTPFQNDVPMKNGSEVVTNDEVNAAVESIQNASS